jgi:hypothetical protein
MNKLLFVAMVAIFSLPVLAQQSAAEAAAEARQAGPALPPDAATREQVLTLMDLWQARRNMTVVMDNLRQILRQSVEQSFREKVPNPTPQQLEALRGIFDDIDTPLEEMVNALVPIYQRHFTTKDVDELIRFYSSPVGQKMLREQPQLLQESMQAGASLQEKRMDEIKAKVNARLQKLLEASGTAPKK